MLLPASATNYTPKLLYLCASIFFHVTKVKLLVISDYRSFTSSRPEAEIFIGLKRMGLDVTIMTYDEGVYVERFKNEGIRVIDFHPRRKFDKKETQFIRNELVNGNYNVLHLFNSKATFNGIRASKGLDVKVVLYRGYTGNIHWWDPAAYFKYLNPRVDKIVCLADSVFEMFMRQITLRKSKLITINKGHALEWYADTVAADLTNEGFSKNDFVACMVANDRPMKGIPYLLKAWSLIPKELSIHLLLIGAGLDNPKYLKLIKKYDIGSKVHLTGHRADSLSLVKAADLFVLSSIKGEATTKSVIEAMCLGKACVITDICGNRGLVVDHESGLVVPAKNAQALCDGVLEIYHQPALKNEFGEKAKWQIANHFHTSITVEKYFKLYESLINN